MNATEVVGLEITFGDAVRIRSPWKDDGRIAFRVRHVASCLTIPMPFARRCDAEAAMRAIADFADWTQDAATLTATINQDKLRMKMLEAMAW